MYKHNTTHIVFELKTQHIASLEKTLLSFCNRTGSIRAWRKNAIGSFMNCEESTGLNLPRCLAVAV